MADYTESKVPAWHATYTAGATITGGQVVIGTAADTVGPSAGGATEPIIGIAAHDAVTGGKVVVTRGGIQRPIASANIAAMAYVKTAAAGQVVTAVAGTDSHTVIVGIALDAGTTGNPVRVLWRV